MARKRVKVTSSVQKDREALRRRNPRQYGYEEQPIAKNIEGKRFAQSEGDGDFIPLTYDPTHTSWPSNGHHHRRTTAAGYDRTKGLLQIEFFTDGSRYNYGTSRPIPQAVAEQFRRSLSPGKFINAKLEDYGYERLN